MYSSTYLKWFRRLLLLGAVVAGLTASAAGARLDPGTPPDVADVAFGLSNTPATDVSRPPDVRDVAGSVNTATADVFERYASAHPYGFGLTSSELVSSPPDVQDAASALHTTPAGLKADGLRWQGIADTYMQLQSVAPSEVVSSPPDVQDAASALHTTPEGLKADGLRWQGIAQAYQQGGTPDPVTRILAQERGRRLDQGLFSTSTPTTKVVDSGGFDWNDYAIGIGTGIGIALLLGVGMIVGRQQRHRMQPA
jgi:hypothetical protein